MSIMGRGHINFDVVIWLVYTFLQVCLTYLALTCIITMYSIHQHTWTYSNAVLLIVHLIKAVIAL